jgi:hypothetical protein
MTPFFLFYRGGFMLKKRDVMDILLKCLIAIAVTTIICLCTMSASCKISPEGIRILETDYTTPKLINIQLSNSSQLFIEFDKEIALKQLEITNKENSENKILVDLTNIEKNTAFFIDCKTNFSILEKYDFFGVAEDEKFNTLTFSATLQGFNANVPKLAISELRTYYQKPSMEFVELVAQTDGNIAGMVLEVYYKSEPTKLLLPPVDVKSGDYIIVHGRSLDETCVNESDNWTVASHKDAVADVLDLWINADSKVIGNSGVILLRERENAPPVDALLYTEPGKEEWGNASMKEAAREAVNSGVWVGTDSVEDAAINVKPSGTRTLSKDFSYQDDNEALSKNHWIFVNNGNATIGKENKLTPYEP